MSAPNITVTRGRSVAGLEVASEVGEVGQFKELASSGRVIDVFALERPGEVVRNKDGVEASGEGRIDVGFGTVADHPCGGGLAAVM